MPTTRTIFGEERQERSVLYTPFWCQVCLKLELIADTDIDKFVRRHKNTAQCIVFLLGFVDNLIEKLCT